MDPASKITNTTRANRMLENIDGYYAAMRTRYNKSTDELWCTPTNLDAARGEDWSGVAPYVGAPRGSALHNGGCSMRGLQCFFIKNTDVRSILMV